MKAIIFVAAAATAMASGAFAQSSNDAYITQLGDNLNAVNVASYFGKQSSTQVISQQGSGFSAANLASGTDNSAYAYQIDSTFDNSTNGASRDSSNGSMSSLIVQSGSAFNTGNNTAINAQLNPGGPGSEKPFDFTSQTIQLGDNNTAINWTQRSGISALQGFTYNIAAPSVSVTAAGQNLAPVSTGVPFSLGMVSVSGGAGSTPAR
jgi:hypothetical protein